MGDANRSGVVNVSVTISGVEVPDTEIHAMSVELDLDQPDMCQVSLTNIDKGGTDEGKSAKGRPAISIWSNRIHLGDELVVYIEVKEGPNAGPKAKVFSGEVAGIEPSYGTASESRCVVRAFNRLHRMVRGRKSRTFQSQKDSDIVRTICSDNGLAVGTIEDTGVAHDHIYQHNQNDLEFLRIRAARNGFECVVDEENRLHFRRPKHDQSSGVTLVANAEDESRNNVLRFSPKISSAGLVQQVDVRGWDPIKKREIVGIAKAQSSPLGGQTGPSRAGVWGSKTYHVEHPVWSQEEADQLARARLREIMMDYISADATCLGNPVLKPGIGLEVEVNPYEEDKFNGRYMVVSAVHRYSHSKAGGGGGYQTLLRMRRDADSAPPMKKG